MSYDQPDTSCHLHFQNKAPVPTLAQEAPVAIENTSQTN